MVIWNKWRPKNSLPERPDWYDPCNLINGFVEEVVHVDEDERRRDSALLLTFSTIAAHPAPRLGAGLPQQQESKRKVKKRVEPAYPEIAKRMRLTGKVRIQVVISPEGRVTSTKELGGNPVLVGAAEQAVKEWSFEPAPSETTEWWNSISPGTRTESLVPDAGR